jgi:hypothetical protein
MEVDSQKAGVCFQQGRAVVENVRPLKSHIKKPGKAGYGAANISRHSAKQGCSKPVVGICRRHKIPPSAKFFSYFTR